MRPARLIGQIRDGATDYLAVAGSGLLLNGVERGDFFGASYEVFPHLSAVCHDVRSCVHNYFLSDMRTSRKCLILPTRCDAIYF